MTKPISPQDLPVRDIPDFVIEVFNNLIIRNMRGRGAVVTKEEAISAILLKTMGGRYNVVNNGWLDVEDTYREAGWDVEVDGLALYFRRP